MRYEILAQLGKGGMGEVFLSRMHRPGEPARLVALKRLRPELAHDAQARARFRREARASSGLTHANLVALEDWGVDRSGPYLALEYVQGRTASALLKAHGASGLPVEVALGLALDVARGLLHAHRGIEGVAVIHRDVSLDNILVSGEGVAKLGDFGIAKVTGETELTRTGAIQGKLGSIAPEIFEGVPATPAADVFAFGVAVHTLVCGVAPFLADTDAALMRAILYASPPPARSLRPELPGSVEALIAACLAKRAEERPSMEAVVAALEPHVTGAWREALARAVAEAPEAPPRQLTGTRSVVFEPVRRSGRAWAAAALGGTAVVLLAWRLTRPVERPPARPPEPAPTLAAPVSAAAPPVLVSPPAEVAEPPRTPPRKAVRARPTRGRLAVKVTPWGYVFVDGKLLGKSPVSPVTLAPGRHAVLVVNAELDARETFQVELSAGAERTLNVVLGR